MATRLTKEEIMAIHALGDRAVANRSIARQLGVDEKTVRYHRKRRGEGATDGRCNKPMKADRLAEPIARWFELHKDDERPVNVLDLTEHLRTEHGYEGSYKSVLRFVRKKYPRPRIRTYRRVETPPGAQSQTDWGEFPRVPLQRTGEVHLSAFVMSLSFSRMYAVIWSPRKDLMSWLSCHNGAFRRLGGIPASNRIDNVKTALVSGAGPWGEIHPTYKTYAATLGFHIDPCLPRQPQAKGKTERKVQQARRLIDFHRFQPQDLEELQAETDARIDQWARWSRCPATGETVYDSWQQEREQLRPFDLLPEPFDVSVLRPVHKDCMVNFEQRQYAVPFQFVGRQVEVRGCAGKVQILADNQVLREYERHTKERILIDPTCYEGEATDRVLPPPPLGKHARRLVEIASKPVEARPIDLYAKLMEAVG